MEFAIRKAERRDERPLYELIRHIFEEFGAPQCGSVYSDESTKTLFTLFSRADACLWVAEAEGEVIGCCGIYPTEGLPHGWLELAKFYIASDMRGKGVGRLLMDKCAATARSLGCTHLYLESFPHFSDAVAMYERHGFVRLERPMGASGHTACTVWMAKEL